MDSVCVIATLFSSFRRLQLGYLPAAENFQNFAFNPTKYFKELKLARKSARPKPFHDNIYVTVY